MRPDIFEQKTEMTHLANTLDLQPEKTLMYKEAKDAHNVVARQFENNSVKIGKLVSALKSNPPHAIITCARGSSDHAATYAKYMFETQIGILTSSAAPSVRSVYGASLKLENTLFVAISQSGASTDLLETAKAAKEAGAMVVAFVNVEDSPLARLADHFIPLHAGPELSVAATKTYIATLAAILHLTAEWSDNDDLRAATAALPEQLREASNKDWGPAVTALEDAQSFFVLGRGTSFGIAQEAALKFKETCGLHAEAYSGAEVKHGPMAIVGEGFPVLAFTQNDATRESMDDVLLDFIDRDAVVMSSGKEFDSAINLPHLHGTHPVVTPILAIQSFYPMVNALSVARGHNPDEPPHLNKVTVTV